jgi:hypothetical protein
VLRAFEQDAKDFGVHKEQTHMLVLTDEKALGNLLIEHTRLVDSNIEEVAIKGSGHWLVPTLDLAGAAPAGRSVVPLRPHSTNK